MSPIHLLLIQIRQPGSPAETQEQICIRSKLGSRSIQMRTRNALANPATPSWLDGVEALIIGGSGSYSVHHPLSQRCVEPMRKLLDATIAQTLPCFGICFGHQLLGLHMGARVETVETLAEFGTVEVSTTPEGQIDPVFETRKSRWSVHTGHTDTVTQIPAGVTLLARNDQVESQAFRVDGLPFYTTQFHPDLSATEALERYKEIMETKDKNGVPPYETGRDESNDLLGRFIDCHVRRP
ncbi:MAG: type 1 glutamine amidotransferase [Planctomycetota bacterium]|nr:type 1 glutamine amidotransferase [Planctomycetota bacterium]